MMSRLLLRSFAATVLTLALSACGFIRPVADPVPEQSAEPVAYDKASCPRTSSCGSNIKVLGKP